jgi:hypothetical protein
MKRMTSSLMRLLPGRSGLWDPSMSRRRLLAMSLAAIGAWGRAPARGHAAGPEIKLSGDVAEQTFDFGAKGIGDWAVVKGQWAVEDVPGTPAGGKALVQRAMRNEFNVIVAPAGPFTDADVSVKFDPLSGKEDASGGIVLRFADGKYYVVRANALEGNFRLYYYDRGRRQLASASVKPPALGQWHQLRAIIVGDHIQAWLDGALLLDHRDTRFKAGRVGLWTKADSITAFNDLTIRGVTGKQ